MIPAPVTAKDAQTNPAPQVLYFGPFGSHTEGASALDKWRTELRTVFSHDTDMVQFANGFPRASQGTDPLFAADSKQFYVSLGVCRAEEVESASDRWPYHQQSCSRRMRCPNHTQHLGRIHSLYRFFLHVLRLHWI